MSDRDPELVRLLILELTRHLVTLEASERDLDACRRAVHALKGSAGLAGEPELSAALLRVERRIRDADPRAITDAAALVRRSIERLKDVGSAAGSAWPEPPEDLIPTQLDPLVRAQYAAELMDRLQGIDAALATGDVAEAVDVAYRHVHTMKGAASAVGDEPMSWFCHGLEDQLKNATDRDSAATVLGTLAHFRGVLAALLDDPEAALRTLRGGSKRPSTHAPPSRSGSRPAEEGAAQPHDDATIRVQAGSVDRLLDRFVDIGLAREHLAAHVERSREQASRMRGLRADLVEALRLIGPPKPWGAPAAALARIDRAALALADLSDETERAVTDLRGGDQSLRDSVVVAKRELGAMRQTPLKSMFTRLAAAVEAEARRAGREVHVRTEGAEETIDRRLAEQLVEPLLQIARNSVAHGLEPPEVREAMGKPNAGTLTLSARKNAHRLVLRVDDDGKGVDVQAVRTRAVESGAVTPGLAEAADDNTLLALLFLPGFSMRESTDLLAGRGIGLDIAQGAIQRLGGVLRLSSKAGLGFSARVEIPVEHGLASVLWVTAGGAEYAVPASNARAVRRVDPDAERLPHLAACLEARSNEPAPFGVELTLADDDDAPFSVGVDAVGRTEEVFVRPLTSLVTTMGPFAGAVMRENGALHLAIDVYALAPRARALGRVPSHSGVPSERPR